MSCSGFTILKCNTCRMQDETRLFVHLKLQLPLKVEFWFTSLKRVTSFLYGVQQISIELLERLANTARVLQALLTWAPVAFPNSLLKLLYFIDEGKWEHIIGISNTLRLLWWW